MARRFLDDIRADLLTLLPDNVVGEISPADVRGILRDIIDSTVQDEAAMTSPPSVPLNLTPVPTEYPAIFDASIGGLPGFLTPNPTTGRFELSPTPGFSYQVEFFIQAEGQQNAEVNINIMQNGVPVGESYEIVCRGPGRGVSTSARWIELSGLANMTYGIGISSPTSASISVTNAFGLAVIVPTNSP
jgi:hypothetical protein